MSDEQSQEILPEASDPTEFGGQVDGEVGEPDTGETRSYFNWDEYADEVVKLPVGGEEIEIPLKEALSGYQRQADYTRKTQELAEQRREVQFASALQQALDKNPAETLAMLQQHYGVGVQQEPEFDEYMDPWEKEYRTLDSRIRAFEEQQAMQQLESTVQSLQQRYGSEFDADEVIAHALATGSTDLEAVYKQIAFDRVFEATRSANNVAKQQQIDEQKVVEAKRQAAVVSSGPSAASASHDNAVITSLRDAYAVAKQQLGMS